MADADQHMSTTSARVPYFAIPRAVPPPYAWLIIPRNGLTPQERPFHAQK